MKLVNIILIGFTIYLIRRFFQLYQVIQKTQKERDEVVSNWKASQKKEPSIDADFKVIDPD